jgi:hypothetical protein
MASADLMVFDIPTRLAGPIGHLRTVNCECCCLINQKLVTHEIISHCRKLDRQIFLPLKQFELKSDRFLDLFAI